MSRGLLAVALCVMGIVGMLGDSAAIVIRHDVDESKHLVPEPGPEYLVDLAYEGHAVLIAGRWLVTVAHTLFHDYAGMELSIGGETYTISRVVVHPDYQALPSTSLEGDSEPLMRLLSARSDIALIELASEVSGVEPITIYRGDGERGLRVEILGRGSTGNGVVGEVAASKADRTLRRCENIISETSDRWLSYAFDRPESALPLEGMHGSGDSGGPSVATIDGQPYLVGLSSWQYYEGGLDDFIGGRYGVVAFQVRISAFAEWIGDYLTDRID